MELTDLERAGRFLCKAYFDGRLKPSAMYESKNDDESRALSLMSQCVERVLADEHNRRGTTGRTWRSLMAGDLRGLNTMRRRNLLGGGAERESLRADGTKEPVRSIDGSDDVCGVRELEIGLYCAVGTEWMRLCQK